MKGYDHLVIFVICTFSVCLKTILTHWKKMTTKYI